MNNSEKYIPHENYTASSEEIIKSIAEVLRSSAGETIEQAAHAVGLTSVKYTGDSMFEVGLGDQHEVEEANE